ncbi:putative heat shock protein HSP104 [Tilletiopsis washingtonensis]|jgi:ATP-dependent Clp protease ATP-binding subunit ClpA|uniref:Putative heat shock protein HSP104 n=1 Tax=Tilletiopsis washingtonensis TaxID=58919 RepID=A0A316ZGH5_9BASI|nr:putative heat shock protein HSP104 [Tilletiopsis washingtonensis]PWN99415.1 putative heat shock protein HSP104 [Tilletiopsis washingtonensis]
MEFTDRAQAAVSSALQHARDLQHAQLQPAHLALTLLNDGSADAAPSTSRPGTPSSARVGASLFRSVLGKVGVDAEKVELGLRTALRKIPQQNPPPDEVGLANTLTKVFKAADELKKQQHDSYIANDHILLALLGDSGILNILKEAGLPNEAVLKTAILASRGGRHVDSKASDELDDAISKYTVDLTALAASGKIDNVIGRDQTIRRVIRVLSQRRKANAVLVGPAGVGKTAIAEGLAQRVVDGDVPPSLKGRVLSLDLAALLAGAKFKGEHEERVKSLLTALEKLADSDQPVILFIDEVHLLMAGKDSGGGIDGGNLMKPALARGKLRVIAATTPTEYRQTIEKDAALERRFQRIDVDEPTAEETLAILRGVRDRYENHHGLRILDSALVSATTLARRYLSARRCPDSALDLIDEACADVKVTRETVPSEIDELQRRRVRLEVALAALSREKDEESKTSLAATQQELAKLDDELGPMLAAHEAKRAQADALANARRRLDELRNKADRAERNMDYSTASDLRFGAIPDIEARIVKLEEEERKKIERGESDQVAVGPENIAAVVARMTGIPVTTMLTSEKEKILKLPRLLSRSVIGQPEATNAIANAIQLQRAGLANPNQPASFLFAGPSGAGKTLCAKTLAKILFNDEDALLRIDASEYSEQHSVSRLFGAPPGYIGFEQGGALEPVRRKPYTVVLVDEVEKASKPFILSWLAILDDGRATDSQGRVIDFRNAVIIFTSNLGSAFINDAAEEGPLSPETRKLVDGALAASLAPEFRNRLSATVIFRSLSRKDLRGIVDLRLAEIAARLKQNGRRIRIELTPEAKDYLAATGWTPAMGARPLGRVIANNILSPLSRLLLSGQVLDKETVRVTLDGTTHALVVHPNHAAPEKMDTDDESDLDDDDEMDDCFIEADPLD